LQGHLRRLLGHRYGDRLRGRAPLALAGQFIFGRVGQLAGRPGAAGCELPVPAAAGGALVGGAREPSQGGTFEIADRRRRSRQFYHRCRVRHHDLLRLCGRAAGAYTRECIAGTCRQRSRGQSTRGGLDAAPTAGRRTTLRIARAPDQGRRLTHRHRIGRQLQIDGRFHGRRTGTGGADQGVALAASSERRDCGEPKRAAKQTPGNDREGTLAIALRAKGYVRAQRGHACATVAAVVRNHSYVPSSLTRGYSFA